MSKTTITEAAEKTGVEITELTAIEPTRVDGVGTPANGFPILMMKSIAAPNAGVVAAMREAAAVLTAKADGCGCGPDCDCTTGSAKAAKPGKTPEQKAAAKAAKAARKAAELQQLAQKAATDHTGNASGTNASSNEAATITSDVIAKAVTEAVGPLEAELKTLRDQMAKVLSTPIPGGPQLVTPHTPRTGANPAMQKAERLRAIANQTLDPETRVSYLELAAREEGASITKD